MKLLAFLFFLTLPLFSQPALAQENLQLCLRYIPTGQKYAVNGYLWNGTDLSRATGQGFELNRLYAIIFWDQNQASTIRLDYNSRPTNVGFGGTDQNGARWHVARATSTCLFTR